jgi:hypothetical protein
MGIRITPRVLVAITGLMIYESIFFITDSVYQEILLGCLYCVVLMMAFGIVMIFSGPDVPDRIR